jgi:integrase/recombinase XerD
VKEFPALLEAFFTDWLITQRRVSPATVAAYRDAFRLFLAYLSQTLGKAPSAMQMGELDAPRVASFLAHLEQERGSSVRTRNARLAALRSFYRFCQLQCPEHIALIQRVLAIQQKRGERAIVCFLSYEEMDALLAAPDRSSRNGRRDHALLLLAGQTGLRVSELVGLTRSDLVFGAGAHVRCHGKGRKERTTPMTKPTAAALRRWVDEEDGGPQAPVFTGPSRLALTRSAVDKIVARHCVIAAAACPSLTDKRVSPHVLRHTCAMHLLWAGVDTSVIALWLGHERAETTLMYLHADLRMKEKALERVTPPQDRRGRYRPADPLLAFLESL